jgi:cytochrome c peroxidase
MEKRHRRPLVAVVPLAVCLALLVAVCSGQSSEPTSVDGVLGKMPIPAGNPQTPEKIELGKLLFFDPHLSGNNAIACATCHDASKGLSDGQPRSIGAMGELSRNAMTVWNVAYMDSLHSDGGRASLEDQAAKAIPAMAMAQPVPALVDELNAVPEYRDRFQKVFGDGVTLTNIARAVASYERSLVTYRSTFDRFRAGDSQALSAPAKEGMDLFFDGRAGCSSCHTEPLFTDNRWHVLGVPQAGPKAVDPGRFDVTQDERDRGAFKTPTLRNVELSAPYMHDGVFGTLEEVVAFYAGGGGAAPNRSPLIKPLALSPKQQAALVAFLRSLTDTSTKIEPPKLP